MLKVAIVILNWNGRDYLEKFLPDVVKTSDMEGVKVFVADNNSNDDSLTLLKSKFPGVDRIALDKNYGFAEGYNRALSKITAEYFMILNSDVQVTTNWLQPLVNTLDRDPLVAACSPKIKSYEQQDFFEYAGAAGGYIDKYGYAFCRGRVFEALEHDFGQYDTEKEVFWTTGACMLIRGALFKLAGGFDSNYFAHFEEIDLCWRLKNRGYKFLSVPTATVFHIGGGTLHKSNPRKTYLNFRNNLFTILKNHSSQGLAIILFQRLVLDAMSFFRFLAGADFGNAWAVLRAHFAFYRKIGYYRIFRAEEKRFITRQSHKEIYPHSIVMKFFLGKKYTFMSLKWLNELSTKH